MRDLPEETDRTGCDDVRAALRRVADAEDPAACIGAWSAGVRDALARRAVAWTAPPAPANLVACPSPVSPPEWHRRGLEVLVPGAAPGREAVRARLRAHARWLGHHLFPDDPALHPRVTVTIPVRDAAALCAEAVESALAQTWPAVDVVVVDDGSRDDLDGALARFGGRVRTIRRGPTGLSAARNAGIAAARGELIHLLDADDLLHPTAVEEKVRALAAAPDAEACISRYRAVGDNGNLRGETKRIPPVRGPLSATSDLLATVARRYPMHSSTVLIARHTLLEVGPYDESLMLSEDTDLWYRLGLRDTRVAAVDAVLTTRRLVPGGLSSRKDRLKLAGTRVRLMNLARVLEAPRHWVVAGAVLRWLRRELPWRFADVDPSLEPERRGLLAAIDRLPEVGAAAGHSARPVVLQMRAVVRSGMKKRPAVGFFPALVARLERAAARCTRATGADRTLWWSGSTLEEPDGNVGTARRIVERDAPRRNGAGRREFPPCGDVAL